jgi:hypothetical protein
LIVKWILSVSLLALVLWHVPLREIGGELRHAKPLWVIFGIGLYLVIRMCAAYRMHLIIRLQEMSLSTFEIFKIGLVTSFFGLFLPGHIAGGAIRWHLLSRKGRKGVEALASVAFDRLNDTIVLMSLGGICLLAGSAPAVPAAVPWILGGCLLLLLATYAMLLNPRTTRLTLRIADAAGLRGRPWLHGLIMRLIESMQRFHGFPVGVRIGLFALSLVYHVLGTLTYFLLAGAIDLGLSYTDCGWLRALLHLLFLLPLSVSGIGVREGALVVLLLPLGISSAQAVAYSFLLMAALLLMAGIGGLLAPGMYIKPGREMSR